MVKFNYDWSVFGTIEGIIAYLRAHNPDCVGLHFQGKGWYFGGDDTLLILPEDGRWRLFGWKNYDPRPIFQQLLALENCYNE